MEKRAKRFTPMILSRLLKSEKGSRRVWAANRLIEHVKKGTRFTTKRLGRIFDSAVENIGWPDLPNVVKANRSLLHHLYGRGYLDANRASKVVRMTAEHVEKGGELTKAQLEAMLPGLIKGLNPGKRKGPEPDFVSLHEHLKLLSALTDNRHLDKIKNKVSFSEIQGILLKSLIRKQLGGKWMPICTDIENIFKDWEAWGYIKKPGQRGKKMLRDAADKKKSKDERQYDKLVEFLVDTSV